MGFYEDRIFPWILEYATAKPPVRDLTVQALRQARGDVLEIGFGAGRTVPLYPDTVTRLAAVEPSGGLSRIAAQRVAGSRFPIQMHQLKGERLPFQEASFDTVVIILTLCTVDDPAKVLAEARRVLKPDGVLLFLEHHLSDLPGWARWQHRLNGMQRVIGCGCNLNREPVKLLRQAGFTVTVEHAGVLEGVLGPGKMFPVSSGQATLAPANG